MLELGIMMSVGVLGSDEASFTMYTFVIIARLPWRGGYMHLNICLWDITFCLLCDIFTFMESLEFFTRGLQDRLHELSGYGVCPTPEIFSGRLAGLVGVLPMEGIWKVRKNPRKNYLSHTTANVFHIRVAHTNEWRTKTPKIDNCYYYYTTTLHNNPYSTVIDSCSLSHVRALWPTIPHNPQRFRRPLEPTCRLSLATSVRT